MILSLNPRIEAFNEDCMEVMKRYPNNHFDLAICDPNYGIGASRPSKKPHTVKQKNGNILNVIDKAYKHKDWDDQKPNHEYFDQILLKSKEQIIWGVNHYNYLFPSEGRLVWDKLNGTNDQFGCEIAYISQNHRTDMVYYLWAGMFQGIYCGQDISKALLQKGNKQLNEKRIHPTQKPLMLYKYLLQKYAKPGDLIFDSHGGSLNLAIACWEMGFDLSICETDKDYFEDGVKRFKEYISNQKLFTPQQLSQPKQLTIE